MFPGLVKGTALADPGHDYAMTDGGILVPDDRYGEDFDIVKLMEDAKDPDTGLLRDMKIDDRDLKTASNFWDYNFNLVGKDAKPPWMIQMWIGLMLFAEVCPCCSNKKWLDIEWFTEHVDKAKPSYDIKEGLQLLEHGICPKCMRTKWDLIQNHGLKNYTELVNVLGQRSGKSSSGAGYMAYHTHRLLKFPRIADMTDAMQRSTELTLTFVSLTFAKAIGLIWTPYRNIINDTAWFKEYHKMLDFHGQKLGAELYRKKDEFITYYHKGLRAYPTNPKSQTLRGDTRVGAMIDELGLFPLPTGNDEEDEQSDRANADEAHKSLMRSLTTVSGVQTTLLQQGINCPPAIMIGVSSPISFRDKVMRLLADSRSEVGKKSILGVQLPTWKVNPFLERTTPIIAMAYDQNAEKAERDYGANPPRVAMTFIKPNQIPRAAWTVKNSHALSYVYDTPGALSAKLQTIYRPKWPSLVTIDAGSTNNSFTLTGAHFDFDKQRTVVSTVLEIMPHDGRRIDFNLAYTNIILPVCKDLMAVGLIADQWQSLDILSRARADMGQAMIGGKVQDKLKAVQYTPRRKDFDALVSMIGNGMFDLPFLSDEDYEDVLSRHIEFSTLNGQPVKHLFLQMLTVADAGPKKCPEKGAGFTDDIFRALVLQTLIHSEAVMKRLKEAWEAYGKVTRAMPMPAFKGRSSY